ncbi:MAG: SAM-dependent methyltransferase [Bacteroidales bacterium]|nr:SAM-dependent methyltransferase [Bacteroidales bacterium]
MNGKLYLVPVTIGSPDYYYVIPSGVLQIIKSLRIFIVEDLRSARRFLRLIDPTFPIDDCDFIIINKHSSGQDMESALSHLGPGSDAGLMSEAGMPGIADPGSGLVLRAHSAGFNVVPLSGPSSIFLALMSSGLNGQNFAFNGYLPRNKAGRTRELRRLETLAGGGQSQIFMETPYRNMKLLQDILATLKVDTYLCIAANITYGDEFIMTRRISEWRKTAFPNIDRKPAIFILGITP